MVTISVLCLNHFCIESSVPKRATDNEWPFSLWDRYQLDSTIFMGHLLFGKHARPAGGDTDTWGTGRVGQIVHTEK